MKTQTCKATAASALVVALGALMPGLASAQSLQPLPAAGTWRYSASLYMYLPDVGGSTSFPTSSGGGPVNVGIDQILDKLQFTFMGTLGAHNGRWGVFTDFIYLNMGDNKTVSRDFTIGGAGLPAGSTAQVNSDFRGTIWTLAGEYRTMATPTVTMDVLGGARMLQLKETIDWSVTGNLGGIPVRDRSGSFEESKTIWDAIVGVRGRYALGSGGRWSVPFYLDVGTGESQLTWQAAGGIAYAYSWGELTAMWRYLAYDMKSGRTIQDLNFSGPMLGAVFRF